MLITLIGSLAVVGIVIPAAAWWSLRHAVRALGQAVDAQRAADQQQFDALTAQLQERHMELATSLSRTEYGRRGPVR